MLSLVRTCVQPVVGKLRSHKPCEATKKKKKKKIGKKKEISQEILKSSLVNSIKVLWGFLLCFTLLLCLCIYVLGCIASCDTQDLQDEFLVAPFGI